MTLVSAGNVALYVAADEATALANAEIGAPLLGLGSGALLMLIGGAAGSVASKAVAWLSRRRDELR